MLYAAYFDAPISVHDPYPRPAIFCIQAEKKNRNEQDKSNRPDRVRHRLRTKLSTGSHLSY